MLVPVGVSTGGHIKKIGTLVLVEDGHIKKIIMLGVSWERLSVRSPAGLP
jgi:hypothetical protein